MKLIEEDAAPVYLMNAPIVHAYRDNLRGYEPIDQGVMALAATNGCTKPGWQPSPRRGSRGPPVGARLMVQFAAATDRRRLIFLRSRLLVTGLLICLPLAAIALLAPLIAPYDPLAIQARLRFQPPSPRI